MKGISKRIGGLWYSPRVLSVNVLPTSCRYKFNSKKCSVLLLEGGRLESSFNL